MALSRPIDNHQRVETPEGIDFVQAVAGPVPRILAYLIDFGWRCLAYMLVGFVSQLAGGLGTGAFLIFAFLLEWFYPVLFEVLRQGQTPGKRSMGLRVVNADFTPVGWGESVVRNLLRAADFFPMLYATGLISMVLNSRFQRLGDLAAGTLVVYQDPKPAAVPDLGLTPQMPSIPLTREERQGVQGLVLRSKTISEARQEELADILEPLTGESGPAGLSKLKAIGAWLLGGR